MTLILSKITVRDVNNGQMINNERWYKQWMTCVHITENFFLSQIYENFVISTSARTVNFSKQALCAAWFSLASK